MTEPEQLASIVQRVIDEIADAAERNEDDAA